MPFMKGSHRRHKSEHGAFYPEIEGDALHLGNGLYNSDSSTPRFGSQSYFPGTEFIDTRLHRRFRNYSDLPTQIAVCSNPPLRSGLPSAPASRARGGNSLRPMETFLLRRPGDILPTLFALLQ